MKINFVKAASAAISLCMFAGSLTGCGMTQKDLNENAKSMYDAAATVLIELDSQAKLPTGSSTMFVIDSNGNTIGNADAALAADMTSSVHRYFGGEDEFAWIIYVDKGVVEGIYLSTDFESTCEKVGMYPEDANAQEKSLNEINEILEGVYTADLAAIEEAKKAAEEAEKKAAEEAEKKTAEEEKAAAQKVYNVLDKTRVYQYYSGTYMDMIDLCFYDYELRTSKTNDNEYIVTFTGSYRPTPTTTYDLGYEGAISLLVNIENETCRVSYPMIQPSLPRQPGKILIRFRTACLRNRS